MKEAGRHEKAIEKSLTATEKRFDFKVTSKIIPEILRNISVASLSVALPSAFVSDSKKQLFLVKK